MSKRAFKTILFDFDGVLSNGRFYETMPEEYREDKKKIKKIIFHNNKNNIVIKWIRGKKSYEEVHNFVIRNCDIKIDHNQINKFLEMSVKSMSLNRNILKLNSYLKNRNIKTAIFTDNMDVFDRIIVPHNNLDKKFDAVISSSEFNLLKHDEGGKLFDIAMEELDSTPENTLVVDDSIDLKPLVENKGASFYHYENYGEEFSNFKRWLLNQL